MTKLRPLILGLILTTLLAGCASERVKAEARKAKENKDGYVDYYPVGSNLPIRIPKDQAKASADETADTQETFNKMQRAGQHPEDGPQSGIPGAQLLNSPK